MDGHSDADVKMANLAHYEDELLNATRPRNHSKTLPFRDLYLTIFNPLNEVRKRPTGPVVARKKQGPHGPTRETPSEAKRHIIERFISRWRKQVGNDVYPAFRLIIPEKDRERAMYGLKEKTIGKLLIRILKINKDSEDGYHLLNWKLPGQKFVSSMTGDFAGRCYEVVSKRATRTEPGDMLIEEVNEQLDRLSAASKEEDQLPILQDFYSRMNAEELMWLIRMILRQMKIGATEKSLFHIWHPDAETLFNVSSNLKRVCWELSDPDVRLQDDTKDITPMQCFQPQLAQFQMHSLDRLIASMRPEETDNVFYIEEKLDGERMQLHMVSDPTHEGGKRFAFWSRKAKDYTYLYGNGFHDPKSALTRHLTAAFDGRVDEIILDGEMVTWDVERDKIVDFGTLKTAALAAQNNEFSNGNRPLYKVFDILYLNGNSLIKYTLRDRRKALLETVKGVHRRLEVHPVVESTTKKEIESHLREVVLTSGEGLVIKNPRSMYKLNDRNDNWIKVKPEYMNDFGEEFDLIVIGGYYGSGHRGGGLSSFLCGLRASDHQIKRGYAPGCVLSFCKVGGGMTASDYQAIKHQTEGKWREWDKDKPPRKYIRLDPPGLPDYQPERPDVWIKPEESFVVSVKAASVLYNIQEFGVGFTLRFPRFKRLRYDKNFNSSLTIDEFDKTRADIDRKNAEKQFVIDDERKQKRQRYASNKKKAVSVAGAEDANAVVFAKPTDEPQIFSGLNFHIMSEALDEDAPDPYKFKKSKAELEVYVKEHGGHIFQSATAQDKMICVADRRLVHVKGVMNKKTLSIVRPRWLFENVRQAIADAQLARTPVPLPYEPRHMYYVADKQPTDQALIAASVNEWGDSYARDFADVEELRRVLATMPPHSDIPSYAVGSFKEQLVLRGHETPPSKGSLFADCIVHFVAWKQATVKKEEHSQLPDAMDIDDDEQLQTDYSADGLQARIACNRVRFGGGSVLDDPQDQSITHIVVTADMDEQQLRKLRASVFATRKKLPRLVTVDWIERSWYEATLIDEERFTPRP